MHQTLVTLLSVLAVSLPVAVFFTLAGRAVLQAAGAAESSLALWLMAPALGAACWSALLFFILSVVGFHNPIIWASAIAVVAAAFFALRGSSRSGAFGGGAVLILTLLAALAIVSIMPLVPAVSDGGLYFGRPIFDHIKSALVDSIYRQGLPPISPFIAPDGKPAGLFYYYGWYVLAAELRAVFGCSGYIADMALSHVTAFSSLALMSGIAYRLAGSRAAIACAVLIGTAGDLGSLIERFGGRPALNKLSGTEWGIENWLEQSFWVPQHVFAANSVIVAVLAACWLCSRTAKTWLMALVLGASAAAAVTSSIYSGAFVLAMVALPAAIVVVWTTPSAWRLGPQLLAAVVLAGVFTAPMALNLVAIGNGPQKILAFWIYPSLGFVAPGTIGGNVAHIVAFWIVLLPLRLGVGYVLGLWQLLRPRAAADSGQFLFWALSVVVVIVTLLVAQFVKSTIELNDLGWRIVLPAVLLLTAGAGAKLGELLSGFVRAGLAWRTRENVRVAAILLTVGAVSIPLMLFGVYRGTEQFFGPNDLDKAGPQVHRVFARQAAAWADVWARTKPTDLVVSNPVAFDDMTWWGANLPWALYADRSSLMSSNNWASLLSSQLRSSGIINDYAQLLDRVFTGHAVAQDLDALAVRLNVRMVMVTPLDALWLDDSSVAERFERVAEGEAYRLYTPRNNR